MVSSEFHCVMQTFGLKQNCKMLFQTPKMKGRVYWHQQLLFWHYRLLALRVFYPQPSTKWVCPIMKIQNVREKKRERKKERIRKICVNFKYRIQFFTNLNKTVNFDQDISFKYIYKPTLKTTQTAPLNSKHVDVLIEWPVNFLVGHKLTPAIKLQGGVKKRKEKNVYETLT